MTDENEELISRKEVDEFSAKILINFGIINAAAIGATLASETIADPKPFAFGLVCAVFSQIVWYMITMFEYCFGDFLIFSDEASNKIWAFIMFFAVVGTGCVSGACIVYGCLLFFDTESPMLFTFLICGLPFSAFFYILMRKSSIEQAKEEKAT